MIQVNGAAVLHCRGASTSYHDPLISDKVAGDVIQNAFSTMEEEEAIAEVTGDFEFARKLIKEKNQLINPNARYLKKHCKS